METLESPNGYTIYTKTWKSENEEDPKALVFIVHGYGEHMLHYEDNVIPPLINSGFMVFAQDHFGHGHTAGDLSSITSFDIFPQDVIFHINNRKPLFPNKPIFIIGHSLGGLISLDVILKSKDTLVTGVVLIAPAMKASPEMITPMRIRLGKLVARFCPRVIITQLKDQNTTRNTAYIEKYADDPLVFNEMRAGVGMVLLKAQLSVEEHLKEITVPIFIIHGTSDFLTHISGSHETMAKISSEDKTLKVFEGAYHQVHNEPDGIGEEAMKLICEWIKERC